MNNDQYLSTSPVEYEEAGPRYSESYLAKVERFQRISTTNRNSGNFLLRSSELTDDGVDSDRSVIVAPIRDFVEEDDKEAENISIPDRLCQPESPTVACTVGSPESVELDTVTVECLPAVDQYFTSAPSLSQTVKVQRQSSEEKERTFGSLGPMNKLAQEIKEPSAIHNRPRSQVSGWAKLFASTLQRSKSTVSQDLNSNMQKGAKQRPGRKSEQSVTMVISSNSPSTQDTEVIDAYVSKVDTRKKKRSIGVDMREKLGFFRKPTTDAGIVITTNSTPSIKSSGSSPSSSAQLERVWKTTGGPPTREQVISWSNSFEDLLFDKHGISLFLEFLRSEFSDENLEFWSECQKYRSICCPKELQEKATQIYEDYVAEQSPREINIDSVTRIQTSLDIPHATASTFDQSQKKIQALMEKDSYQRFLRSDLYHSLETVYNTQSNSVGKLCHANSAPGETDDQGRVSYIPGLLPRVTAGPKCHQIRTNTNPSLLTINTGDQIKDDRGQSTDQGQHRSAPSSPKNTAASNLS